MTNSAQIASLIESLECKSCEDVEAALEKEVTESVSRTWSHEAEMFEQHMKEEDDVFRAWRCGEFETRKERCRTCGQADTRTGNRKRCDEQWKEELCGMQSNPTAAWDDITGAPLDPIRVTAARRLEIEYADRKPVWRKISRKTAKSQCWKIVRS